MINYKKLSIRVELILLTIGFLVSLVGGGIFLVSEILYGQYPNIAYTLGISGLGIIIMVSICRLIFSLIDYYKNYW